MTGRSAVGDSMSSRWNSNLNRGGRGARRRGLEPESRVLFCGLARCGHGHALGDGHRIGRGGLQTTIRHEGERPPVLLEPSLGRRLDAEVGIGISEPVLVEGDLDPGIGRDVGGVVFRERSHDA